MNISKSKVRKFLTEYGALRSGDVNQREIWILDEFIIIQLPLGNSSIDYEIFQEIAEQMNINIWELDYWLGQNNIL